MWTKTPAAGGSGETRAAVAEWHGEGRGVDDGCGGWACHRGLVANGAGEHSFAHPPHVAIHCVGSCGQALVLFARAGASSAGVVVVNVATMSVAVVPFLKSLDRRRGWLQCAGGSVVAAAAAIIGTATTGLGGAAVVGRGNTTTGVSAATPAIVGSAATPTATTAA